MQLTKKLFGIITIMVIGFFTLPLNGCSEDGGGGGGSTTFTVQETSGRLTIYGLSDYNGKYVMAHNELIIALPMSPPGMAGEYEIPPLLYAADQIYSTGTIKLGKVEAGSVTLKVWKVTDTAANNYTGNDENINIYILIKNTETITEEDLWGSGGTGPAPETAEIVHANGTVSFTNGVGTFTAQDFH